MNVVYVGMFVFKELYLTAGLYALFIGLAVVGWRDWSRTAARCARRPAVRWQPAAARADPRADLNQPRSNVVHVIPLEPDGSLSRDVAPPQFGVDGEQAERDWPLMTHDEVAAVLARIDGAGGSRGSRGTARGSSRRPSLVQMTDGRGLFVKRHHVSLRDVAGQGRASFHRASARARDAGGRHSCRSRRRDRIRVRRLDLRGARPGAGRRPISRRDVVAAVHACFARVRGRPRAGRVASRVGRL